MSEGRPPTEVALDWQGGMRFSARADGLELTFDGDRKAGFSPVQALAASIAGCMSIDIAMILEKGRLPLRGLSASVVGERQQQVPNRLTSVRLHFVVTGELPEEKVERAIELSRTTYCSVWHSIRQDIDLETSFEVRAG